MSRDAGKDAQIRELLDATADLVSSRSKKFSLDEVCRRLGLDAARVRELAHERHEEEDR